MMHQFWHNYLISNHFVLRNPAVWVPMFQALQSCLDPHEEVDVAQTLHDLGAGQGTHGGLDQTHQGIAVFNAAHVRGEARVLGHVCNPQHVAKPRKLRIIAHGQQEMPVAACEGIIGHNVRVGIAAAHGFLAGA